MKGITTIDAFRAVVRTSAFWGDTWAISTLERELNIKLVLFSSAAFHAGDIDNVLQCGQLNDTVLERRGTFEPSEYILCNYLGEHYELITYRDVTAFTFARLPYDVKKLIVNKCMERMAGPYYIIPDLRDFMQEIGRPMPEKGDSGDLQSDLYGNDAVFQFYSKSKDGPPGSGAGEKLGSEGRATYNDLSAVPGWRRKLSNFWEQPFTLHKKRWQSVEHYYQGSKYKKNNPHLYDEFSLDSGSALSKDPAMAKGAGGKKGKFKGERVIPEGVTVDPDFFKGRSEERDERCAAREVHAK